MTRAPRPPKSIESFGPEILEALVVGSKREVVLELSYKKAVMFRQRANSLRAAMRSAGHELYAAVSQTSLRIVWGKDAGYDPVPEKQAYQNIRSPVSRETPSKLIITPSDSEFTSALRKAGVEIRPLAAPEPPHTEAPKAVPEGAPIDALEQYLKQTPS